MCNIKYTVLTTLFLGTNTYWLQSLSAVPTPLSGLGSARWGRLFDLWALAGPLCEWELVAEKPRFYLQTAKRNILLNRICLSSLPKNPDVSAKSQKSKLCIHKYYNGFKKGVKFYTFLKIKTESNLQVKLQKG